MAVARWPRLKIPLGPRLDGSDVHVGQSVVVHWYPSEVSRGRVEVRRIERTTSKVFRLEGLSQSFTWKSRDVHVHPFDATVAQVVDKQEATLEALTLLRKFTERVGFWGPTDLPDLPDRVLDGLVRLAIRVRAHESAS